MLDPALLHSLDARFPPEQPAIVEERVWRSVAGEQAERLGRRMADNFDKAADEWLAPWSGPAPRPSTLGWRLAGRRRTSLTSPA